MAFTDSSVDVSFNSTFGSFESHQNNVSSETPETIQSSSKKNLVDKAIKLYLRHNLSLVALEDVMKFHNEGREGCVKLPEHKKKILKLFHENCDKIKVCYMVRCSKCKKIVKIDSESTETLKCCDQILKKSEKNFFVYMPVEDQISRSVKSNWSYIKNFDTSSSNTDSYSDAHDGEILKSILELYKDKDVNILSLCLNIDGANKFKSNTVSLWPVQLTQNYLPPKIRFQTRNIIVAGLYYGDVKVNCKEYLLPLVEEMKHLKRNEIKLNIDNEDYTFKPVVTHAGFDLPAKSLVQETKQFGGYFACTYCKIRGELVLIENHKKKKKQTKYNKKQKESTEKNEPKKEINEESKSNRFVRYVEGSETPEPRNEVEMLKEMLLASNSNNDLDGVKDISCLVALEHFNIVHSVGVEYMHCCLLGVEKRIINFFVDPKYSGKDFYISPKARKLLNQRILAIKPPAAIVRKPRSMNERPNFKASEYRFLLLYYLPVVLPGLVPNAYIQHVRRLSAAVYILLKANIPKEEVNNAENMLLQFVKEHQNLFGKENMVMVVHLLKHLAQSVRKLGPLWCHSAFPFERNNGVLLKMVSGTTDVLLQVSSKYALSKSMANEHTNTNKNKNILLGKCVEIEERSLHVLNIESRQELDWSNVKIGVYKRIKLGEAIYTSLIYKRPKRSIDYFIGLGNEQIGMAKFYIEQEGQTYVVIEEFEVVDYLDHILKVRRTNRNIMAPIGDIEIKYLFMKVGLNEYVCSVPNPYEIE